MATASRNAWVAVDSVSDRLQHARALRRLHDAFQGGQDVLRGVRAVVAHSWERSDAAGIDPAQHRAPIVMDERELEDRWNTHPLYPVLPVLRELLTDATKESGHMLVISDARGVLLWIEGHQRVIEATEDMHFVTGADWSEAGAGTNALGTAIAVDHPVQIFSAEHYNRIVHPWQCSGAPIHDPETGELLGVIDLTGHLKTAHPHTLSLVSAAAGMAEVYLRQQVTRRDEELREAYLSRIAGTAQPSALVTTAGRVIMAVPHDWLGTVTLPVAGPGEIALPGDRTGVAEPLPGGGAFIVWREPAHTATPTVPPAAVMLQLLGPKPQVLLPGRTVELTPRHGEILAILALFPQGLTAEQLTLELYGEHGKAVTVRAELSRLRRLLGPALQARPYRLRGPVQSDLFDVEQLLQNGRLARALERCPAPLLPASDAPRIVQARERLDSGLRRAVMQSGDTALLAGWTGSVAGAEDQPAVELLLSLLDAGDARHPAAAAHAARLRRLHPDPSVD